MKSSHRSFGSRKFGVALLLASGAPLQAAEIFKAPNADDLGSTSSWVGGSLPTDADVAVWDATVPAGSAPLFSLSTAWRGIKVVGNDGNQMIDSFNTTGTAVELALGAAGLDASAATSGTTFLLDTPTVTLRSRTSQTWSVGDGATVHLMGPLKRGLGDANNGYSGGSHIHFNLTGTGEVKLDGGVTTYAGGMTANTIIPGATIGSGANLDFAAMDSNRRVVPLHSLTAVGIPNGTTVTALPGAGTFQTVPLTNPTTAASPGMGTGGQLSSVVNVINQRQASNAPVTGFSLANSWQPQGLRFSVPRLASSTLGYDPNTPSTYGDWTVVVSSGTTTLATGIIVNSGVGKSNVVINGSGTWRIGNTPWLLGLHQDNTAGDLIINVPTIASTSASNSSVLKTGGGRVIVTSTYNQAGSAAIGGGLAIHGGTYQVGNNTATGNLPLGTIANQSKLVFNRTGTLAVTNVITGPGSLTNNGTGDIQLSGASVYTGATEFNAGTITMGGASALGVGGALNFAGGKLVFGTGVAPDLSDRLVTFVSGTSTLDVGSNNVAFVNPIGGGGAGGFVKAGSGKLSLSGANTYSGSTTISAGELEVLNSTGSGTGTGAVGVGANTTLSGTGQVAGLVTTVYGSKISPGSSGVGTLTVGGLTLASGARIDAEIASDGAHDAVVVADPGALTINGGSVAVYEAGTTNPFGSAGSYPLIQYSGSVQGSGALNVLNPAPGYSYTFATASGNVTLTVALSSILTNWTSSGSGSWSSAETWSNGVPTGGYTVRFRTELGAPATVTLDGDRSVNGIVFSSAQAYTVASGTPSTSTLTLDNGANPASINVTSGSHVISAPVSLASTLSASTDAGATLSLTGVVSGAGGLVKSGAGRLSLTAANTFSGPVTATGGVLAFSDPSSLGLGAAITVDGATLEYGAGNTADLSTRSFTFGVNGAVIDTNGNDVVFTQAIGGGGVGRLTKTGAGSLTLSAASTFTGGVLVTGGELSISNIDQIGSGMIELNGGILDFSATGSIPSGKTVDLGASGGTIASGTGATVTLASIIQNKFGATGALTLAGPGAFTVTAANTFTGGLTVNGATATFSSVGALGAGALSLANSTISLPAGASVTAAVAISGTNTVRSSGVTTYNVITGSGVLNFNPLANLATQDFNSSLTGFSGVLGLNTGGFATSSYRFVGGGTGSDNTTFSIAAGVSLGRRHSGSLITLGALEGAGNLVGGMSTANTCDFQIGRKNLSTVFSGVISDGTANTGTNPSRAKITKVGTGTLTLSGVSTYTSSTLVNDGILLVDGALTATDLVTVNAANSGVGTLGGTLGGTGSIAGPVSVTGILRPNPTGLRQGTLSLGSSLDLSVVNPDLGAASSVTRFDFGGTTSHRVVGVSVAGALTYGGALEIAIPGTIFNGSYALFTPAAAPTGSFASIKVLGASDAVVATLVDDGSGVYTGASGGVSFSFAAATGSFVITGAGGPSARVLTGNAGDASASLSWNSSAGETYDVYRSLTSGGAKTLVADDIASSSFTDSGLTNGTTYFYTVTASNDAGTSTASNEVSLTPFTLNVREAWRQTYFPGSTASTGPGADAADADNDGRLNLLEYALGSNPTVVDSGPGFAVSTVSGQLSLTYTRIDDPTLTYTVQGRSDLATGAWSTVDPVAANNPLSGLTGTQPGALETEPVTVVDPVVIGAGEPRRFLRLQVSY